MNHPKTFAELLPVIQSADCLTWNVQRKILSVTCDDFTNDRRTCMEINFTSLCCDVKTLCGYDSKKDQWGEYCKPCGEIRYPDKRGMKAVESWLNETIKANNAFGYPLCFLYPRRWSKMLTH